MIKNIEKDFTQTSNRRFGRGAENAGKNSGLRAALFLFFIFFTFNVYAQRDDSAAAQRYVEWIQQAINEDKWGAAQEAVLRAWDFKDVSSDISYLMAVVQSMSGEERDRIIEVLDIAVQTNRWVSYSENHALLLKAELFLPLRKYANALACLDQIDSADVTRPSSPAGIQMRADSAMLRLRALKGLSLSKDPVYDPVQSMAAFRSQVLIAMDRFPRDSRPLHIFFEYARNRMPEIDLDGIFAEIEQMHILGVQEASPDGDINLLELALRRLPFLLQEDPELAWMAAPFIRDLEYARRILGAYRAETRNPNSASIPIALNLGLIDDNTAIEELFEEQILKEGEFAVLEKDTIINTYNLLRSEEGRELFTQKLHSFSGFILWDEDRDGYIDTSVIYDSGVIQSFSFDKTQNKKYSILINFNMDSVPAAAFYHIPGQIRPAQITWERYPFVKQVDLQDESLGFTPAEFRYSPVTFIELGGSRNATGLLFPVPAWQYMNITRHELISNCISLSRPSLEIEGAQEVLYMERGMLLQAVETLNGNRVSITEFERGLPIIQHIDLDLDGRMETIRRFRIPPQDYSWQDLLDFRRLMASSESDWAGDGRHKTMEVYLPDGSVVYYFDIDGSGEMNVRSGND